MVIWNHLQAQTKQQAKGKKKKISKKFTFFTSILSLYWALQFYLVVFHTDEHV